MILLMLIFVVIPIVQIYFFLNGGGELQTLEIINYISSILIQHWVLGNIIIASKIPLLQNKFPYDKRVKSHIASSVGIFICIAFHGLYKILNGYYITVSNWILIVAIFTLILTSIIWIPLYGFRKLRVLITKSIGKNGSVSYDSSKLTHKVIIFLLLILILKHIYDSSLFYIVSIPSLILYITIYSLAIFSLILSNSSFFSTKVKVVNIERINDILIIKFQPNKPIKYKSGQFTFLGVDGKKIINKEHPFSFLSFPREVNKDNKQIISLGIRVQGDFTNRLLDLKEGDDVFLSGAYGNFHPLNGGKNKKICFIASGIGTVPVISLLKDIRYKNDTRNYKVFLAVNTERELPDINQVLDIASTMDNVDLHFMVYSKDKLKFSKDFFITEIPQLLEYKFYLCSSPSVLKIVLKSLKDLGVSKSSIFYESFNFG